MRVKSPTCERDKVGADPKGCARERWTMGVTLGGSRVAGWSKDWGKRRTYF